MGGDGVSNPADLTATNAAIEVNRILLVGIDADLEVVDANVDLIRLVTDGLPTLTESHGETTTTVINTEYTMFVVNAPIGVFRPLMVAVNFLYHTAGETVIIRKYRRDIDGGVWTMYDDTPPYIGIPDPRAVLINLGPNRYGIYLSIERTAGAARAYPWAAFYEI